MKQPGNNVAVKGMVMLFLILLNTVLLKAAFTGNAGVYWWLLLSVPLLLIAIYDVHQRKDAFLCNYPLIGHLRFLQEAMRPASVACNGSKYRVRVATQDPSPNRGLHPANKPVRMGNRHEKTTEDTKEILSAWRSLEAGKVHPSNFSGEGVGRKSKDLNKSIFPKTTP